jgi:hypothetical protein
MFIFLPALKMLLILICVAALVFVGWRFILPLAAQYLAGVGVAIPLPKRFSMAHPKLTIYVFIVGAPLLFLVLSIALMSLVRWRLVPR